MFHNAQQTQNAELTFNARGTDSMAIPFFDTLKTQAPIAPAVSSLAEDELIGRFERAVAT